jgi:hypothetical protein
VPDGHKIDKIKNTAEFASRKIGFPIKAIIITSQKSSASKELGKQNYVKILDSTDIDQMIGYHKKNHLSPARQISSPRSLC